MIRAEDRDDELQPELTDFHPERYIPAERRSVSAVLFSPAPVAAEAVEGTTNQPHQPHMGYALLALLLGFLAMLLTTFTVLGIGGWMHVLPPLSHLKPAEIPKVTILGEALGYALALAVIVPLFRRMWHRPFAEVLRMNARAARANLGKLLLFGVALSILAQAAESLLTLPKNIPLDAFFRTPADVWTVALFGTLVAPPIEELLFRGFLFPAFAIAFDWLRMPRTPEAKLRWTQTAEMSRPAVLFSAVLTSLLFGAMHAAQLGFAWNAVALLSCVGGVLTAVRVRFRSVWASSVVHMVYNGFIFAIVFVLTDGFRHLDKMHGH